MRKHFRLTYLDIQSPALAGGTLYRSERNLRTNIRAVSLLSSQQTKGDKIMVTLSLKRAYRSFSLVLILALVSQLCLQSAVFAQSDQGRIVGTVRDQSNAVVTGAAISVKNDRTGETRTTTSSDSG